MDSDGSALKPWTTIQFITGSEGRIESCIVRDSTANDAGLFGDSVVVMAEPTDARATILSTRIERSARAAIAAYGAHAALGNSVLSCQAFDLDAEAYANKTAQFEDLGGNFCGCPEATGKCAAVSSNLQPPSTLESSTGG
jgi:hypothetical protein